MADILGLHGLRSGYGDFQALFDVSFALREGTLLGLVGRLNYCTLKTELSVTLVERGSVAAPNRP